MDHLFLQEIELLKEIRKNVNTSEIQQDMMKRVFSVKDVGITSRVLFNWEDNDLLFENHEPNRWKKFDLIEYTWLKMVLEMRKYKISLKIIKEVKQSLLGFHKIKEFHDQELFSEAVIQFADADKRELAKELLNQDHIKKEIEDFSFNLLEFIVLYIFLLKGNYSLLVNSEGNCIPLKFSFLEKYLEYEDFKQFISGSFISISITNILRDFMIKNEIATPKKKLQLLDEAESNVLNKMREENVTSVLVKKNCKNEIEMIEEFRIETIDKSARLMDIIMNQGYQTITIKTQKGEIVNCTNIIKTKLENM